MKDRKKGNKREKKNTRVTHQKTVKTTAACFSRRVIRVPALISTRSNTGPTYYTTARAKHSSTVNFKKNLTFYYFIVPLGFLQWENRVALPRESQLQQSRATQATVHAGFFFSFFIIHRT